MTGTDDPVSLARQIAALRTEYVASLPGRWDSLSQLWQQLDCELPDAVVAGTLQRFSHQLAGSAGMYGFTQLGQSAEEIESLIGLAMEEGFTHWSQQRHEIIKLMNQLKIDLKRQGLLPN